MQDDIQLTPSPDAPDANSVQPASAAAADTDAIGDRIFDITDDLNISPAKDIPVKTFPSKVPQMFVQTVAPKPINPVPQSRPAPPVNLPGITIPSEPVQTAPPLQPKKPSPIPLSDFSASLEKAKTINSAPVSFTDTRKIGRLPTEIGKDPITQNPNLKPLRTYEGDVAEVLAHNKTSTASIAIAEAKKQEGEERIEDQEEPSHTGKKIALAFISLLLIGGGIVAAYYFYSRSPLAAVTPQTPVAQVAVSLVPPDSQIALPVTGLNPIVILSKINNEVAKHGVSGTITEIVPIQTVDGATTRLSAQDMLNLMEIAPPDILTRSLNRNWMLGIYQDNPDTRSAFVVVSTNFFQNAFAGMLQWESVMADDLRKYLASSGVGGIANTSNRPPDAIVASTTAVSTSTVPSSTLYSVQGHFVDRIIMNKDVRSFQTYDGKTLFLYSFVDNTRLVIAANEATLMEIITRLEKQAFVR